jgi:hypothetical protein
MGGKRNSLFSKLTQRNRSYLLLALALNVCIWYASNPWAIDENQIAGAKVCVLVRSYKSASSSSLLALLHSLRAQTVTDFIVWIIDSEDPANQIFTEEVLHIDDHRFRSVSLEVPMAYSGQEIYGSYGYYATDFALREVLLSSCQYLVITNGDNMYQHEFFSKCVTRLEEDENYCMVGVDFVSRYRWTQANGTLGNPNNLLVAQFARGRVDLGAVMVKLSSVRKAFGNATEYFVKNNDQADIEFFLRVIDSNGGPKCAQNVREILFIHQ